MPRPQINVNVTAAIARRGAPTATGTAFMLFAAATGPTTPTRCLSEQDALDAGVPTGVAAWVGDCLSEGAPEVVVLKAAAVDNAAVTEAEWTTALGKLTDTYGPGQVLIPGVATAGAYAALLDHSSATGRTVLLDTASAAVAATVVTAATGLAAGEGAERAGFITPWVTVPAAGGTTRDVPGSVIAAALAARGDARVGHTNHAPAGDQGVGAGVVNKGVNITTVFTTDELDDLADAGVSVIEQKYDRPTLYGWWSISSDTRFHQLNIGRLCMQLGSGIFGTVEKFLFRQIDGRGHLYAEVEGSLRGYLQRLWSADALFGETPDDAFDVSVINENTPEMANAGELKAAVEVTPTKFTQAITIDVVVNQIEGDAA